MPLIILSSLKQSGSNNPIFTLLRHKLDVLGVDFGDGAYNQTALLLGIELYFLTFNERTCGAGAFFGKALLQLRDDPVVQMTKLGVFHVAQGQHQIVQFGGSHFSISIIGFDGVIITIPDDHVNHFFHKNVKILDRFDLIARSYIPF